MIQKQLLCYLLMTMLIVPIVWSQERAIRPVTQQLSNSDRQALVIGNSAYISAGVLRNPVSDAKAISNTLEQLGFKVTTVTDADQREMEQSIRDFGKQLRDHNGVGLFYYAGHGMQFDGENYLLPVDINPSTETDVRYDAVPLGKMLGQMQNAGNRMNLVILDACRNNPFARSFRTFNPGLTQVIAPEGIFISFATAPGKVAADGNGRNGLFTSKLLRHLKTPGIKLEEVFKRTAADVYRDSDKKQVPWVQYAVIGDFYFVQENSNLTADSLPNKPLTLYISESDWDNGNGTDWQLTKNTSDGRVYTGETYQGLPNGYGTMTAPDGIKYVGNWLDGRMHGQGTFTWPDGRKYVGAFKDGFRHGQGTFTWVNGDKYIGAFKDGFRHGQGTYTFADGRKYVGQYKDDKWNGQGTLTYPDGRKYVGSFKNDKKHGQGTMTKVDEGKYVGAFQDGNMHGEGKMTISSPKKHIELVVVEGLFKNNKPFTVQMTITRKDSSFLVVRAKDGKGDDDSLVTLTFPKNIKSLRKGCFALRPAMVCGDAGSYTGKSSTMEKFMENMVESQTLSAIKLNGYGTTVLQNGDKYIGEFKDGFRHGEGIFTSLKTFGDSKKRRMRWVNGFPTEVLEILE